MPADVCLTKTFLIQFQYIIETLNFPYLVRFYYVLNVSEQCV